jgi:hypothetical protein
MPRETRWLGRVVAERQHVAGGDLGDRLSDADAISAIGATWPPAGVLG